jgi:SOS-response transcriptional repressor LexA
MTPRQQQVLSFIVAYQAEHEGVTPSLREIAVGVGNRPNSFGPVWVMLKILEDQGYIARPIKGERRGHREIRVLRLPGQSQQQALKNLDEAVSNTAIELLKTETARAARLEAEVRRLSEDNKTLNAQIRHWQRQAHKKNPALNA